MAPYKSGPQNGGKPLPLPLTTHTFIAHVIDDIERRRILTRDVLACTCGCINAAINHEHALVEEIGWNDALRAMPTGGRPTLTPRRIQVFPGDQHDHAPLRTPRKINIEGEARIQPLPLELHDNWLLHIEMRFVVAMGISEPDHPQAEALLG